jgi:protoheme IX farnesyltransferase
MSDITQMEGIEAGQSDRPAAVNEAGLAGFVGDVMLLVKARLTLLVVVTTFVGFCMASSGGIDWAQLAHTVVGTALVAAAAAAFNQVLEVKVDRLMERTRHRPVASGRMTKTTAVLLGTIMAVGGFTQLAIATTWVAAYLSAASLLIYIVFYTPMKRHTALCVTIGAVSGAIPPVIGWTAVDGSFGIGAWVLFGILFAWQMPHFLAIAWMYRDEYSQAGFVMLPRKDKAGTWTAIQALLYSVALTACTLVPFFIGKAGYLYLAGAVVFNLLMVACAIYFLMQRTRPAARLMFFASIVYLPGLLFCLMVFTNA